MSERMIAMPRAVDVFKIAYLFLGAGLLAWVLATVEIEEVWSRAVQVGLLGMTIVLLVYIVAFAIDSFTWQLTIEGATASPVWLWRAFKIRMVGEAFNYVMPAAGIGGEPVKAGLLKHYYGIGYREGTASLILSRTVNTIAQVWFLAIGFAIAWTAPLPASFKIFVAAGLATFVVAAAIFFFAQRLRVASLASSWLGRRRLARRVNDVLHHIQDMDDRLVRFYTRHRRRFAIAVVLALVNWALGAVEIWVVMPLLGRPITFAEAWMIEAVVQLVRTAAFLIPAGVGAQEGAFLLVYSALTGAPELGVAMALVRRFREALWLAAGAAFGAAYSIAPAAFRRTEKAAGHERDS